MKTNLIIMTLMCVYMYKLAVGDSFVYYIHPRYIVFSIVATLVCSLILIKTFAFLKEIHFHEDEAKSKILSVIIILTLILALATPAQSLTSTTALKRFNSGNQSVTIRKANQKFSAFFSSPEEATALILTTESEESGDIFSNIISNIEDIENIYLLDGAQVEIVGFIIMSEDDALSRYHITRFFLGCCTADANPIGIPFEYTGERYEDDDWIKIKGTIDIVSDGDLDRVFLIPEDIESVKEPKNPYVYF